ncbi:diguanylate cyclase (GGDEF)-like protein [Pelomonas saccharophila]|uniref:diguanylate cyclase n=1 Tax=Roseateles saccharophilus TaxID=304 RepID=A0ABU1YM83_ROSSA|nr:diguanylate cyclase [Roseateles saccharophilus]MDR7269316.1 diguanylate cyclase (GGDEF)-like protein [Roseateles saccharophilus]
MGWPGLAQAQPVAAASTARQEAKPDLASVKRKIEADDRRRPMASIELARQALAAGGLKQQDRNWLRIRLVNDLIRLDRTDEVLAETATGRQQATDARESLHFDRLAMRALVEARRHREVLTRYENVAAQLPTLAADGPDADARLLAADVWRLAGTAMMGLGRLPEATELLVQALRILDERPDAVFEFSQALTAMALVHSRSGRIDEALRTVQRAIDASEAAADRSALSSYYLRKAHFLGLLGRPDEQLAGLLKARAAAREELRPANAAVAATNLADVALQKKDYPAALAYAEEAIPLVERSGGQEPLWVCWVNKGIALNRLGRPEGLDWMRKAIAAFASTPGMAANAADVQGLLAEELAFAHDYPRAYEAAVQFKRMTDEVRKAADQKRITDANAAYEADKRRRQIDALEQETKYQRRFRWVLALAAAAGLAAAVIAAVSRHHVKRAYQAMRDMAFSDPLTGLRNRRHLVDTLHEDLAQARRLRSNAGDAATNADVVFMMIDVDHFKAVNDVHGHAAGDAVLKQCAAVLHGLLRESDTLVRWGGEEFLVLARQTHAAGIHVLAERLRAGVAGHDFLLGDGQVLRKTCSIGYACHPLQRQGDGEAAVDWNDTLALADQCLYVAKASGRNLWVGITPGARPPGSHADIRELRAGVDAGLWTLHHGAGREIVWPAA